MLKSLSVVTLWGITASLFAAGCVHPVSGELTPRPGKTLVLQNRTGQARNVASGHATLSLWNWDRTTATVRLVDANREEFDLRLQRSSVPSRYGAVTLAPAAVDQAVGFRGTVTEEVLSTREETALIVCSGFGRCRLGEERTERIHFNCPGLQNRAVNVHELRNTLSGVFTSTEPTADFTAVSEPYEVSTSGRNLSGCRVL